MINKILAVQILSILLAGCVNTPVQKDAGQVARKVFKYPLVDNKIHLIGSGIFLMTTDYVSGYRYRLVDKLDITLGFGAYSVFISSSEELTPSIFDNEEYHCVTSYALKQLIGASTKNVCLKIKDDMVESMRYAPSAYWFTFDFDSKIKAKRNEINVDFDSKISKTEIVFEGSSNDKILFIKKTYRKDLNIPTEIKPIAIDRDKSSIEMLGAVVEVNSVSTNSITYSVKNWN